MKKITILSVLSILILQLNAQKKTMIPQYEGYKLVFQDEFEKDGTPNKKKWDYEIGFVRNKEPQWYQPENAYCKDGFLNIVAKKEEKVNPNYDSTSKDWTKNREFAHYTSACLISKGKFEFKYGKVVMRGKIDTKKGMWPAFWMLGVNRGPVKWPACGEIDIMEYYHQNLLGNIFWDGGMKDTHIPLRQLGDSTWSDNFHEWVLDWTKDKMRITVDGREVNNFDLTKTINKKMGNNPFNEKMYLLLNLALGQGGENIPSENLPATFLVDYVRIYQQL